MEVSNFWSAGRYWTDWPLGCMGWPVYLSAYCTLYTVIWGSTVENALYLQHMMSVKHSSLQHLGKLPQSNLYGVLLGREGSQPKDIWPNSNCSTRVNRPKKQSPWGHRGV